jgi:hypothetical protein
VLLLFKEFNGEKKTATKTSNMFKIVPRIGTCDANESLNTINKGNRNKVSSVGIIVFHVEAA